MPGTPVMTGATAPRLQPVAQLHIQDEREESAERPAPDFARAYQKPLFEDRKIVPFPQTAPPRVPRAKSETGTRRRSRVPIEGQGELDFLPPAPAKPRTLGTTVEAVIYCEFPVATPMHRAVAGVVDWAMVLIGFGLFLGIVRVAIGPMALNKTTLGAFGGMLFLIGLAYGLCFSYAGTDTPGMRFARLRLTTFDGFPPDRRQRMIRFFGGSVTRCTLLGLLWCLADEESLGWQDHISRTFPTPDDAYSAIVHPC